MSMTTAAPAGTTPLARSRAYCEQLTRSAARNFYYGLKLLPEPKRSAMFALYAYMRLIDDIADDEDGRSIAQRAAELDAWQARTRQVLIGQIPEGDNHPIWHAFREIVGRYNIPPRLFEEAIAGQRRDLEPVSFENYQQLHEYCYHVAGVVGLASIHIWGFVGGEPTELLAIDRGVAFQLTNILRDLREDAARGRIYLPKEDLAAADITEEELRAGRGGERFLKLMNFEIERARSLYRKSAELESRIEPDSRPTLVAMTEIYHRLLEKIAADPERVLSERVSLSVLSKLRIGWRALRAK